MNPVNPDSQQSAFMDLEHAWWIVGGLLVPIHLMLLGWLACRMSPTSDEVAHLAAGVRIWTMGKFDLYPVNPPLVKAMAALPVVLDPLQTDWSRMETAPGARPEWKLGQDLMQANAFRFRWDFVMARWMCLPFGAIGLIYCFRWGLDLFGPWGGLLSASCWCFSPNLLGNGALITPDVPATALGVVTLYYFRRWLQTFRWSDALLTGLLLGLTELTKLTWLVLYGVLPVFWLVAEFLRTRSLLMSPRSQDPQVWLPGHSIRALQLIFLLFISLDVLNAGYLFEGTCQPLRQYVFVSELLTGEPTGAGPGNRFQNSWWGTMLVPLPEAYVLGIDLQRCDFEGHGQPLVSYLRGELRSSGWWYYYAYGLLVKVPLGIWLITGSCLLRLAVASSIYRQTPSMEWILLLTVPALLFLLISSQTGFSRYFRYVLPCFPFAWIALGSTWLPAAGTANVLNLRDKCGLRGACIASVAAGMAGIGVLCLIGESMRVYPHSLSFFNIAAGGPQHGHRHLLDANVDWGQDLYTLCDWIRQNPQATPLFLAYSGVADPQLFGIPATPLPYSPSLQFADLSPGWYAVSVNHLHGYDQASPAWAQFLQFIPVDRAGYSIFIYHLEPGTQP